MSFITPDLYKNKSLLLELLREAADKILEKKPKKVKGHKAKAKYINEELKKLRDDLVTTTSNTAHAEKWDRAVLLKTVLMITYCCNVVMVEYRNTVWPYEFMSFSRRVGELWEPFCKLCWLYPVSDDIRPTKAISFTEVRQILESGFNEVLKANTTLSKDEQTKIRGYIDSVWELVSSGEIDLSLDLHFEKDGQQFNVDFKSGFGSNEKGNTNRLLLVGSIYKKINPGYKNVILVRSEENENNHYLQTLKSSPFWEVYCGDESYDQIHGLTGFPLKEWIKTNVAWEDLSHATMQHLKTLALDHYLKW